MAGAGPTRGRSPHTCPLSLGRGQGHQGMRPGCIRYRASGHWASTRGRQMTYTLYRHPLRGQARMSVRCGVVHCHTLLSGCPLSRNKKLQLPEYAAPPGDRCRNNIGICIAFAPLMFPADNESARISARGAQRGPRASRIGRRWGVMLGVLEMH